MWQRDVTQSFAGEKQICIMHLLNGLDLKTGLSPPEGFEGANRELSWARGCSCGPTAVLRVVLALVAHLGGCWCLGGPLRLPGAVRLVPTRARASWEPPGVPLASPSGGINILQDEQGISSALKTSPLQSDEEGIIVGLAHGTNLAQNAGKFSNTSS